VFLFLFLRLDTPRCQFSTLPTAHWGGEENQNCRMEVRMSIQQYQTTPRGSNDALSLMTFHHQLCKKRAIVKPNNSTDSSDYPDVVEQGQEEVIQLYNLGYGGRKRRKHEKEENENNNDATANTYRYQKSIRKRNSTANKSALSSPRWDFISKQNTTNKSLSSSARWNFISNISDDAPISQLVSKSIAYMSNPNN